MILVKVETKFILNRVGIREKFVEQALRANEPLGIEYQGETMYFMPDEIRDNIVAYSKPMRDRLGGEPSRLAYFTFRKKSLIKQMGMKI